MVAAHRSRRASGSAVCAPAACRPASRRRRPCAATRPSRAAVERGGQRADECVAGAGGVDDVDRRRARRAASSRPHTLTAPSRRASRRRRAFDARLPRRRRRRRLRVGQPSVAASAAASVSLTTSMSTAPAARATGARGRGVQHDARAGAPRAQCQRGVGGGGHFVLQHQQRRRPCNAASGTASGSTRGHWRRRRRRSQFSPAPSTWIIATPVGARRPATPARSTPPARSSGQRRRRTRRARPRRPSRPRRRRARGQRLIRALAARKVANDAPVSVSPGGGSRATRATRSRLIEPKTTIIAAACRSAHCARARSG